MKPRPCKPVKWFASQVFSTTSLAKVKARAQSAKVKAKPDRLSPGDRVCLVGLKSSVNGENGTLVSYDAERKRWAVELSDGVKNVLRANLCKSDESPMQKPQATPLRRAIGKRPMQLISKDLGLHLVSSSQHNVWKFIETECSNRQSQSKLFEQSL